MNHTSRAWSRASGWIVGVFLLAVSPFGAASDPAERVVPHPAEARVQLAISGGKWIPQGPGPSINGQIENVFPEDRTVGAVHAIAPHPTNADILYVASVNGGIWRTLDATATTPTWEPLTDDLESLSTTAIRFDPTDPGFDTLLAGHGTWSSFGFAGGRRNGLLYTQDGGASWSRFESGILTGITFSSVEPRGEVLVAAAVNGSPGSTSGGGLFRSTDRGMTWEEVSGQGGTGLPDAPMADLEGDPSDLARLYVTARTSGVYRSDDTGATWTDISQGDADLTENIGASNVSNAKLTVTGTGRVYIVVARSGAASWIGYTDNPTAALPTWTAMDLPLTPEGSTLLISGATNASPIVVTTQDLHGLDDGTSVVIRNVSGNTAANGVFTITVVDGSRFRLLGSTGNGNYSGGGTWNVVEGVHPGGSPGSQGTFHLSVAASGNTLWVGGDRQPSPFPNFIGGGDFSGRLFRGDTTVAATGDVPSPQWEHLTHRSNIPGVPGGGTAGNSSPHADSRDMRLDAAGNLIEADDGGIYRRSNPFDNTGDWFAINGTLQSTEFHDVAYDNNAEIVLGGAQDNGTSEQIETGGVRWRTIGFGDGGDVAVDDYGSPGFGIRYFSSQRLQGFRRATYDADNALQALNTLPFNITQGDPLGRQFVQPIALNAIDPTRLLVGGSNSIFESFDQGATGIEVGPGFGVNRMALATGGSKDGVDNPEIAYVGSGTRVIRRTSAGGAFQPTPGAFPGGTVRSIVLDPRDHDRIFVVDSDQVFQSQDAGLLWQEVTGNLVDSDLRAVTFAEGGAVDRILVGGRDGVYVMLTDSPGVWNEIGDNLPQAPVYDLDYDAIDDVLVAGTLGRGAWAFRDVVCLGAGDDDGDGECNVRDNCPDDFNPGQVDTDLDLVGDVCDDDDDDDGVPDTGDNCDLIANPEQVDVDGDGNGDACDNCPQTPNADQAERDGDGFGDACDCAVADPGAFAIPETVSDLQFNSPVQFVWDSVIASGGASTVHTVFRGHVDSLPVGNGLGEGCFEVDLVGDSALDFDVPAPGQAFWYLVGGENGCGAGSLGDGVLRMPITCAGCTHDRCEVGDPLGPQCDDGCIGAVCAVAPECCSGAWDASCVDRVLTVCDQATCPSARGTCEHSLCVAGAELTEGCDVPPAEQSCVEQVCAADVFCCLFGWDATCVSKVQTICGLDCDGSETEPNDTCVQAAALNPPQPGLGETVYGEIGDSCDYDSFKFTLTETTSVRLAATNGDFVLELVDCGTDTALACDDDSAGAGGAAIEACLASGEYCVRLRAADGVSGAGYVLQLGRQGLCSSPSTTADDCPGLDFESCP